MTDLLKSRCFLCRRKDTLAKFHKLIDQTICPASKKCMRDVLGYLLRCNKAAVVYLPRNERICLACYSDICRYDNMMVSTMREQRKLAVMVEKAALDFDEADDDDDNDTLELIEDCEKEINATEEYFDVSDNEIEQTIKDAFEEEESANRNQNRENPQHNSIKIEKERLQCMLCAMKFRNKYSLQKHLVHTHKKFSCQVCDYTHRNEDYVLLHQNIHEGRSETHCRFCYKDFSTRISTIRHMEVHLNTKKYQCDKCGLCFSQTTVLYNHKLQHEAEEKPLQCDICHQVFKTKRTFRHHQITHQVDRPRYTCEYCGKTFTEKYTLKVHRRTHPEVAEAALIEMEQQQQYSVSVENQQLQQQQQSIANPPSSEARFICIICDTILSCKDHLNRHMEREHDVILKAQPITDGKKPCHICGHMFSSQSNLDYHLEHMHGGILQA